jgi:hypothetical protein
VSGKTGDAIQGHQFIYAWFGSTGFGYKVELGSDVCIYGNIMV